MSEDDLDGSGKYLSVVGLNCSQDVDGDSARNLNIVLERLEEYGAKTQLVHLENLDIRPRLHHKDCQHHYPSLLKIMMLASQSFTGFLAPKSKNGAVKISHPFALNPDMKFLFDIISNANGLVIATPVHWREPSSLVVQLFECLNLLDALGGLKGKAGAVIESFGFEEGGVGDRVRGVLNDMGVLIVPYGKVACCAVSNYMRRNPKLEAAGKAVLEEAFRGEIDGTTEDLKALAGNIFLTLRILQYSNAQEPEFWH